MMTDTLLGTFNVDQEIERFRPGDTESGRRAETLIKTDGRKPEERSRPFDRLRDGFVISEGAAVLVLEDYERAKARNAPIYAEVRGWGSTFDAFSVTKPDPEGRGGARAIQSALDEAKVGLEIMREVFDRHT